MSKLMFKGFDKNLKCRDFQYEVGKEYIHDGNIKVCKSGFHACENPMDVFEYYPPNKARYCEVTGDGKESSDEDGKKTSFEKIKINAEIGLGGIIKAGIKFCFDRVKWTKENTATGNCSGASATGYKSGASATGYKSGASATGDYSGASATGNCSGASATGYKSGASAGKGSIAMAVGLQTRAKGEVGSWLVLTECRKTRDGEINIKNVKVAKVDGIKIKADTWYTLERGKFIEAKEEDYE